MQWSFSQAAQESKAGRMCRMRAYAAFTALALIVSISTVYTLSQPAATLTREPLCGLEEHRHTEECCQSRLICGYPEGDNDVYGGRDTVTAPGTEENDFYGLREPVAAEPGEGHIHSEDCYLKELICGLEEHTHTDLCFLERPANVPEDYTDMRTVTDIEQGFTVTVYAPTGALPEDVSLAAELLAEDSGAYAAAGRELEETMGGDACDGYAALDIHLERGGAEYEPGCEVYVDLQAAGLLPAAVAPESVSVRHHIEPSNRDAGEIQAVPEPTPEAGAVVEVVADATGENGELAVTPNGARDASDLASTFAVEHFSTFTVGYKVQTYSVKIQCVGGNGSIESSPTRMEIPADDVGRTLDTLVPKIKRYQYTGSAYFTTGYVSVQLRALRVDASGKFQYTRMDSLTDNWISNPPINSEVTIILKYYETGFSEIETLDTREQIQISLFDYFDNTTQNGDPGKTPVNESKSLHFVTDNNSYDDYNKNNDGVRTGIVQGDLVNGFPVLNVGDRGSLDYLFTDNRYAMAYPDLSHLFVMDNEGYYSYDSSANFAKLNDDGTDFIVYDNPNGKGEGARFMPFNAETDDGTYPDFNYHFGMKMGFEFIMPPDGKIDETPMRFEFSGDDDMWVFIDGKLVLDLGGIHGTQEGTIDFGTGAVTAGGRTQLGVWEVFMEEEAKGEWDGYSTHRVDFFYMERGAGASNCRIRFNLPVVPEGTLRVGKRLEIMENTGGEFEDYIKGALDYQFEVLACDASGNLTDDSLLKPGMEYSILDSTTMEVINTETVDTDGKFRLKADEIAQFAGLLDEGTGKYAVRETLPANQSGQYGEIAYVVAGRGGTVQTEEDGTEEAFTSYTTSVLDAGLGKTTTVLFANRVDLSQLSSLTVRKLAAPGTDINAEESFEMQVTLDGVPLGSNTAYLLTAVDGTETSKTVRNGDGIIALKAGESFRLKDGLLAGAEMVVTEAENGYHPTYGWSITAGDGQTETGSSGQRFSHILAAGSQVDVTVTNADYDFAASVRLGKTLAGWTEGSYTFPFKVEQVTGVDDMTPAVETTGTFAGVEIIVDSAGEKTGDIQFGYRAEDGGTYYYKISEDAAAPIGGVTYDGHYYVVEITVGADGAKITGVTKHGADGAAAVGCTWEEGDPLSFVNSLSGKLSLTKHVERTDNSPVDPSIEYIFQIVLRKGPDPVSGEYPYTVTPAVSAAPSGTVKFDENGTGTLRLHHGETITLEGLPLGAVAVVTEPEHSGYAVSWSGEGLASGTGTDAETATTNPVSAGEALAVICTNTTGARLPTTGGSGTHLYLLLGLAMTLGAGILLSARQVRKEGRDTG